MDLDYEAIESASSKFYRAVAARNVFVQMRPGDVYLHRQANERVWELWIDLCLTTGEIASAVEVDPAPERGAGDPGDMVAT